MKTLKNKIGAVKVDVVDDIILNIIYKNCMKLSLDHYIVS